MTLLLSAVTPDGLVMGADSAVTAREWGDEITLLGFAKIVPLPRLNLAISTAGAARIGPADRSSWVSAWLREQAWNVSQAVTFTQFCDEFAETLNAVSTTDDPAHYFQVGSWVQATNAGVPKLAPRLLEVSRSDEGNYRWVSLLPDQVTLDIVAWRDGNKGRGYPIQFASTGIPPRFAQWVATDGTAAFAKLLSTPLPHPEITAVAEYVRFLIRMVAELHRVARQPAYVGEPVETLVLFPDSKNMVSTRY